MHIGYSFFFFFPGHWQAAIALPLAGTERDATPLMADKTPLFWQRIERGGERVFQLCPHGERIKLCGRAAGWRGELVGYVIMSILPPMVLRICAAPVTPKEAPGLATGSSSGSLFSLGSEAASHFPQHPKSGWLQKKDNSKTYETTGPVCAWE